MAAAALAAAGILPAALASGPAAAAAANTIACGHWRWPVKTGSDATRRQVSQRVTGTTVAYLDRLTAPSSFPAYAQNHRIMPAEFRTWQLSRVTLVAVKLEDDGDIHLRLLSAGKKMIGEIPLPRCVSSASLWKAAIASARNAVTSRYSVSLDSWHYVNRTISIRGLGFFDEEHNVTGAAPNDIELHPVIWIRFLSAAGGAWCKASASSANDGYPDDNVYITSNQSDSKATASDGGHSWSDTTNGSGSVTILLFNTPPGSTITVKVGAASCSTTAV
jgi:hypothetical protein